MKHCRALLLAAFLLLLQGSAQAICSTRPSIQEEARSSKAIVLVRVTAQRPVVASDDPEGVEAVIYTLKVLQRHKGRTPRSVDIESPNTASRFPMREGQDYLLFLNKTGQEYWVDACGNSAEANRRLAAQIRAGLRS